MDEEPIDMSAECASCHYSHAACVCKHTLPPPTEEAEIVERHYQLDQCDSDEMIAYYWKQEADISRALVTIQEAELTRLRQRVAELERADDDRTSSAYKSGYHDGADDTYGSGHVYSELVQEGLAQWRADNPITHQPNGDGAS